MITHEVGGYMRSDRAGAMHCSNECKSSKVVEALMEGSAMTGTSKSREGEELLSKV